MRRRIDHRPAESDKEVRRRKENGSARRTALWPEALAAFDDLVEVKVVLDGDELMGEGNCMHGKLHFWKNCGDARFAVETDFYPYPPRGG